MKKNLVIVLLLVSGFSFGQKVREIIKKGEVQTLQKFADNGNDIYEPFDQEYYFKDIDESGWETIHPMAYAAALNKPDFVAYYIGNRAEMEELGYWEEAISHAFIYALSHQNEELIQKLYDLNPDLGTTCEPCRQHNAIMIAALHGLDKWYFELKEKSNLLLVSVSGNTILHLAVAGGSMPIIDDLLSSGNYSINNRNNLSMTPLDFAALDSNTTLFFYLIEKGANIKEAQMSWVYAALSNNMEIFNYVLANADINHIWNYDNDMDMALHMAMGINNTEMTEKIITILMDELDRIGYANFDYYPFSENEYHPLNHAIYAENKITYEAFLKFASKVNQGAGDNLMVPIYKYHYKEAKKVFGKDFVDEMYTKYHIEEAD